MMSGEPRSRPTAFSPSSAQINTCISLAAAMNEKAVGYVRTNIEVHPCIYVFGASTACLINGGKG